MAAFGKRLASLVDGRVGGAIFIEGDTGMGKTRLAEEMAWGQSFSPLKDRCVVLASAGKSMRQSEPFYPWRQIFLQLFEADKQRSAERSARTTGGVPKPTTKTTTAAFDEVPESDTYGGDDAETRVPPSSDLAKRLATHVLDYAIWRPSLALALGVQVEELPPVVAPSVSSLGRGIAVSRDGATLRVPRAITFSFHPGAELFVQESIDEAVQSDELERESSRHSSTSQHTDGRVYLRAMSDRTLNVGRPGSAGSGSPGPPGFLSERGPGPSDMSYALRAVKIRALLVAILREFCACHTPLVVVLDDLHLFDGASWRTLLDLLNGLSKQVLVVGTLRPLLKVPLHVKGATKSESTLRGKSDLVAHPEMEEALSELDQLGLSSSFSDFPTIGKEQGTIDKADPVLTHSTSSFTPRGSKMVLGPALLGPQYLFARTLGEYYEDALWQSHSERIALQRFSLDETKAYLGSALGGIEVNPDAALVFWRKSAGMPAYLHQSALFLQLRAKGMLGQETLGEATSSANVNTPRAIARHILEFVRATLNINAAVSERMDVLTPDEQYTLKLCSVMGNTVYSDLLQASHPQGPSARRIAAHLRALRDAGFLVKVKDNGSRSAADAAKGETWEFVDVLALDAIHDLIPSSQRYTFHMAMAKAMVRANGEESTNSKDHDSSTTNESIAEDTNGSTIDGQKSSTSRGWKDAPGAPPWRRSIPSNIIAYHFTHAFLEGAATEVGKTVN